jgi:hypothetical protein
MSVRVLRRLSAIALSFAIASTASAQLVSEVVPPSGVIGVQEAMLSPGYWVARTPRADSVLMSSAEIAARSDRTLATDTNLVDLRRIGPTVARADIVKWLDGLRSPFSSPPLDATGTPLDSATLAAMQDNRDLARIPASQPTRFGMAVTRALLRVYPSTTPAYPATDALDFDYYAAGVLFPGDAVVILHQSRDGRWLLIESWQGPGWVKATQVGEGPRDAVLGYARRAPYRVVTGDKVLTVSTPEAPAVSEYQLDMGARVPIAPLPPSQPVNGGGPYASWTVSLPTRAQDGGLQFRPALIQRARDTAPGYLPLTRANIIRQAFKFLGERYGWGHTLNARDCSGFTSDVYRSFGILMPPNSGAQGASPGFRHQLFTAKSGHAERLRAVMAADVGDLLVVPGHVMMILGKVNGQPYVIQDVPYAIFRDRQGALHKTRVAGVAVTPLLPLLYTDSESYVDAMTSLVHVTAR